MRPMLTVSLLTLTSTALSLSAHAKGDASSGLVAFTIGGEEILGHTLTIAPVAGNPMTTIERVDFEVEGMSSRTIAEAHLELADGSEADLDGLDFETDAGTTAELTADGLVLTGTDCRLGGGNDLPEGVYHGIGFGGGDTDSDGLCDAGDADRAVKGGGGLCGTTDTDGDGVCDKAIDTEPVWGQTVYYEAKAADGGDFVFGETMYFETRISDSGSGKPIVSADLGTESCHVGVWSDEGLVHRTVAPCAEIGGLGDPSSDPGGDPNKLIPKDQHISTVWSDVVHDYVTKVVWTWGGGAIDISYHYPGLAWVE